MMAGAAEDGLVDHRRADDLAVQDDGEAAPDIVAGRLAELRFAPTPSKRKVTTTWPLI